ncbi:MAG: acyl carrier protein [Betaproteobacteria bacterium]|nr:acyl carrier protein [Betaproteobacteria bacterium]
MQYTDEQIYATLQGILHEAFEVEVAAVVPEAKLFEDLDLDSIDAVDLAIKLQDLTGQRVKPEQFKSVRTVADVVRTVRELLGQ